MLDKEKDIESEFIDNLVKQNGYIYLDQSIANKYDEKNYYKFLIDELQRINNLEFNKEDKEKIHHTIKSVFKKPFDFALYLKGKDNIIIEKKDFDGYVRKHRLKFIDWDNWDNNSFVVSRQNVINSHNESKRVDVVIFVNGMPLIVVELKRPDVKIKDAVNQLEDYKKFIFSQGIFRFVQILVASNFNEVKLWANNENEKTAFAFSWYINAKERNLEHFTKEFLNKTNFLNYLKNCFLYKNSKTDRNEKKVILLRPYQKRAIDKVNEFVDKKLLTNQLNVYDNKNNGLIWHTTGSGKTLTSFKIAQLLSEKEEIDKVIFLVDRKDLSFQTKEEFESLLTVSSGIEGIDLFAPSTSNELKEFFKKEKLIISTIQKLNKVLSNQSQSSQFVKNIANQKIIFIVDECHRSQSGDMATRVKNYFPNSILIGFTGTPIFESKEENKVTQNIFGNLIDTYNILDAIKEQNVLGFSIKDFYQQNEEDHVDENLKSETIDQIKTQVLKHHDKFTWNKRYNAIFAFANIEQMLKFYDSFQDQQDIFVTPIFSISNSEEIQNTKNNKLDLEHYKEIIMKRYNQRYDTNFDDFNRYISDVQWRFKKGVKEEQKIDILFVVDMLLTGYDSKVTNTLYVYKKMKEHSLIQSFSRTNRILDDKKEFGNIVNFCLSKQTINHAISLYSNSNINEAQNIVLNKSYEEYLNEFHQMKNIIDHKIKILDDWDVTDINQSIDLNQIKDLFQKVNDINRIYNKMKTFPEFDSNNNEDKKAIKDFNDKIKDQKNKIQEFLKNNKHLDWDNEDYNFLEINNYEETDIDYKYILKLLHLKNLENFFTKTNLSPVQIKEEIQNIYEAVNEEIESKFEKGEINNEEKMLSQNVLKIWYKNFMDQELESNQNLNKQQFNSLKNEVIINVLKQLKEISLEEILKQHSVNKNELDEQWQKDERNNFTDIKNSIIIRKYFMQTLENKTVDEFEHLYNIKWKEYMNFKEVLNNL